MVGSASDGTVRAMNLYETAAPAGSPAGISTAPRLGLTQTGRLPMRKLPSRIQVVSALFACAMAGCASIITGQAAGGATAAGTPAAQHLSGSEAAPLLDYAPGWLRAGCTDTGAGGRNPLPMSGYSDSLSCTLRASTHTEVDYYRYGSAAQTQTAYAAASASAAGQGDHGRWSAGAAPIGDISYAARPGGGAVLIWDDPRTGIVAVASSPVLIPAALYAFWTVGGASIDQSANQATSA